MELEAYFDVLGPDDIRLKGSRIGVETVLYEYIHRSRTPEQIAADFDTLSLEQVYATLLYYLRHRAAMDAYLAGWLDHGQHARQVQAADPAYHDFQQRMRDARAARLARDGQAVAGARPA